MSSTVVLTNGIPPPPPTPQASSSLPFPRPRYRQPLSAKLAISDSGDAFVLSVVLRASSPLHRPHRLFHSSASSLSRGLPSGDQRRPRRSTRQVAFSVGSGFVQWGPTAGALGDSERRRSRGDLTSGCRWGRWFARE
ncbi:uncharacterized protein A4U43_C05F1280 [Asparagus officinalis]|uniref:Uncharacterized protein n=1 Tax=Asparagus officinalis TaxID=4686 RepID=A0A5P1ER09_ASPOF|nr:uncharacterized protein A4U43_C05F1280 [Asparagus officinalis]